MPDEDVFVTTDGMAEPDAAEAADEPTLDADDAREQQRQAADEIARKYDEVISGVGEDDSAVADGEDDAAEAPTEGADGAGGEDAVAEIDTDAEAGGLAGSPAATGGSGGLTARQRDAARHFGLSAEDIGALAPHAPQVLARLVKIRSDVGRRYSQIGRAEQNARAARQADGSAPATDGGGASAALASDREDSPGGVAALQERFDPATDGPQATRLNRLVETVNGLVSTLGPISDGVAELRRRQQRENQRRAETTAEAFFEALAQDQPQFGRGATGQLDSNSPEARARQRLLAKAHEIREGHRVASGEEIDFVQSLQEALAVVSPEAIRSAERRRISESVRHRSRSIISRPAHRHTRRAFESDEQRAAEEIAVRAKQLGIPMEA